MWREFRRGKLLHGRRVFGSTREPRKLYQELQFDEIIIASDGLSPAELDALAGFAHEQGLRMRRFAVGFAKSPWALRNLAHNGGAKVEKARVAVERLAAEPAALQKG